ncbi:hypothetical protein HJFPF1_13372 [Paramyrothecium foliicola]|nr:hypothetical protein HJFPF1_13372 [Paramyrothecium foliicola]
MLVPKSFLSAALAAMSMDKRQASESSFGLYAYGPGIGGQPLVSAGSSIFIGNGTLLNDAGAASIIFTKGSDGIWYGFPNATTSASTPEWSNLTFSVPGPSSSSNEVRLDDESNSTSSRVRDGFDFYGSVAFHKKSDGSMESVWSASPSDVDGLWSLLWNVTGRAESVVPVTLKSTPPSRHHEV